MKNVLLIASRIPYPPIGGDRLKNYNLIKLLSEDYKVHLVVVSSEKPDQAAVEFFEQYTVEYKVFSKRKLDFILAVAKSLINKLPFQINLYYFADVQKYIDAQAKKNDVFIATLVRTSEYLARLDGPTILDMADSLGQNYKKSLKNVKSRFWKLVYRFESDRLIAYEKKIVLKFSQTFLFNMDEIANMNAGSKVKFIPHGVNEDLLTYEVVDGQYKKCVAFFGKMDYQPNIDAVLWFVKNTLPQLDADIEFMIVGAKPTETILSLAKNHSNITVTGFVDDPYEILNSCLCVVAPMQTGAGIQNKLLETMALGTVNIVSSLAANPIGATDKKHYLVIDEGAAIAGAINDIYGDETLYRELRTHSREFIQQKFTWTIYKKTYIDTIEEVINDYKK